MIAAIIIVYYGKRKPWHTAFLKSCSWNKEITWLIFGDIDAFADGPENVKLHRLKLDEFNALASRKSGVEVNVKNPLKLCDLKPVYGHIFEDYISDFKYWGFGDEDLVFGNLFKTLKLDSQRLKYDIITSGKIVKGHFTLLRNSEFFNGLYRTINCWQSVLCSEAHLAFDETLWSDTAQYRIENGTFSNLNYLGFADLVNQLSDQGKLNVLFADNILEGREIGNKILCFDSGSKRNLNGYLYYHILNLKRDALFCEFDENNDKQNMFIAISKFGITEKRFRVIHWRVRLLMRELKKVVLKGFRHE